MPVSSENRDPQNGDPWSPFSYKIGDLGPQFHDIRDPSMKLGTPIFFLLCQSLPLPCNKQCWTLQYLWERHNLALCKNIKILANKDHRSTCNCGQSMPQMKSCYWDSSHQVSWYHSPQLLQAIILSPPDWPLHIAIANRPQSWWLGCFCKPKKSTP